jgi:hypothetical protein
MTLTTLLTAAPALFFIGIGVVGLVNPRFMPGLVDIPLASAPGRSEMRAVYGGFGVAVGLLILFGLASSSAWLDGVRLAFGVATAGMAAGRVVGALLERDFRPYPTWVFALIEVAVAGALLASR